MMSGDTKRQYTKVCSHWEFKCHTDGQDPQDYKSVREASVVFSLVTQCSKINSQVV